MQAYHLRDGKGCQRLLGIAVGLCLFVIMTGQVRGQQGLDILREKERQHADIYERMKKAVVSVSRSVVPEGKPRAGPYYGTGVLISSDGYIISCTSVIPAASETIEIKLHNGETKEAKLIGASLRYEVTLVKIPGENYDYLKFSDSKKSRVGDRVYTAGNAFQLGQQQQQISFSTGVISGIYNTRSVYWQSQYRGLAIEADSAINPGGDGGPIVDQDGKLLGIITLSADNARWLGMATPIHLFHSYLNTLFARDRSEESGTTGRSPYLGVRLQEQKSKDDENSNSINLVAGDVKENGPAWEAGLREGDIVTHANEAELSSLDQFDEVMEEINPGDDLMLYVRRDEDRWAVLVPVGAKPM